MTLTYTWTYDTSVFDLAGPLGQDTLKLVPKKGTSMAYIVSPITLIIRDEENNCTSTKTCYYTPQGMECDPNYVACANPRGLIVTSLNTVCAAPRGLLVTAL